MDQQPASFSVEYQRLGTSRIRILLRWFSCRSRPFGICFLRFSTHFLILLLAHGMSLVKFVLTENPAEMRMLSFHRKLKKIASSSIYPKTLDNAASIAFQEVQL